MIFSSPFSAIGQTISAGFISPDTVCIDESFEITNTSSGGTTFSWNFCAPNFQNEPEQTKLPGLTSLDEPVFMDYIFTNDNYYGFVTNYNTGDLIRLDFGSSLSNNPQVVNLGNFDDALPDDAGTGGLQIVQNEGKWYIIIVAGYPPGGANPRLLKVSFGTNITNMLPSVTNYGNLGNMYDPADLVLAKEGNRWYGFTVNSEYNSITRFDFTESFDNPPTATNLGNPGNLNYPTGIFLSEKNAAFTMFITSGGDNTRIDGIYSLTRLDFGSSLLNEPLATEIGNIGHNLQHPRDITLIEACDNIYGLIANGHPFYNNLLRIDLGKSITNLPSAIPAATSGFNYPHAITKFSVENDEIIGFVVNRGDNSITRISFKNCNNASTSFSDDANPAAISYKQAGKYTIALTMDKGLPTEKAYCKNVVVINCFDSIIVLNDTTICAGTELTLNTLPATSYRWTPASFLDDPTSANPTTTTTTDITYYVEATVAGRIEKIRDSISVRVKIPFIRTNSDTTICAGETIQLDVNEGAFFTWSPSTGLSNAGIPNPVASPITSTAYEVRAIDPFGCLAKDTVLVTVLPSPFITTSSDTIVCENTPVPLYVTEGFDYQWAPAALLDNPASPNPVANITNTTMFTVKVTGTNTCSSLDSVSVSVRPYPTFKAFHTGSVCNGQPVTLSAEGGNRYQWSPATLFSDPSSAVSVSRPTNNTTYSVNIADECNNDTTIYLEVVVLPDPPLEVSKSNDINCNTPTAQLIATGGDSYLWSPAAGLNDATIPNPVVVAATTTAYTVTATNEAGCSVSETITVNADQSGIPRFVLPNAFSPNADGKNDCFGIQRWGNAAIGFFKIFNRWGQIVFQSKDPGVCWDGRLNGVDQPAGDYIYYLEATTICGPVRRQGSVTLIR